MSVDIVNLIESNPITKLNGNYQSKLIEKVKNIFTSYEQQLFLSSFYCYLKYNNKTDFVIDLDNVWKWLDFNQKVKAKILLENHFILNRDYTKSLSHEGKQTPHVKGGHNKETFMLNVDTFKKFCLKAETKKANEIHDYFIKLETIMFETANEECHELTQQLKKLETTKNKEMEDKLIKQKELDNEKFLLKQFNNAGNMVYIIKVKTYENGSYVVKIGESRIGIMGRYNEHKSKYEECTLLDCFCVNKSKDFEYFLHSHSIIKPNIVKNLPNHDSENELFLIGGNLTYKILSKIVNDNIDNYNYKVNELLLEIENLKFKNQEQNTNTGNDNELLKEIIHTNKILLSKVNSLEQTNKEILSKLNSQQEKKIVTGFNQQLPNLGPRLQKINPETLQLIKVYESVTEAMNESKNIKRPSVMKAITDNTIYCGFRWLLVERNLDPNVIHEIKPTKETKVQNLGYIAQLDKEKTKIVNVYIDRKTAAHFNGYTSSAALDNPVKNNSLANGFYYMLYNNCDDELTSKFEEINGAPILYKNGVGQYDTNNNLIKEFECKYDCIKSLAISDKTLTKALTKNIPYNGHYYKEIGEKLKMV
jgi:phage anti-repressor protein